MVIIHRGVSLPDGIFSWLDVSIWSGLSHRKIFWSYHPGPSHGWNELENTGSAVEFSIIITCLGIFWDSQYAIWYVQSKYSKWNDAFGRYWKYNWSITHFLRHHRPSPRETPPVLRIATCQGRRWRASKRPPRYQSSGGPKKNSTGSSKLGHHQLKNGGETRKKICV
jgi:hypothetical protein